MNALQSLQTPAERGHVDPNALCACGRRFDVHELLPPHACRSSRCLGFLTSMDGSCRPSWADKARCAGHGGLALGVDGFCILGRFWVCCAEAS